MCFQGVFWILSSHTVDGDPDLHPQVQLERRHLRQCVERSNFLVSEDECSTEIRLHCSNILLEIKEGHKTQGSLAPKEHKSFSFSIISCFLTAVALRLYLVFFFGYKSKAMRSDLPSHKLNHFCNKRPCGPL